MPVIRSPEFAALLLDAQRVRTNFFRERTAVAKACPTWDLKSDARLVLFNKWHSITKAAELALGFIGGYLLDLAWWEEHHDPIALEELRLVVTEQSQFSKIAYFHQTFGALETSARIFLRALEPDAESLGRSEFKRVYDRLVERHVSELRDWVPLLDLLRLTRNTVHSNGMVFAPSERAVTWHAERHVFTPGQHVEFVTWEFVFARALELAELGRLMVLSPALSGPPTMRDPGAEPLTAA